MKKQIKINYKCIFKYPDHHETFTCREAGYLIRDTDGTTIHFFMEENLIEIFLGKEHIFLKNGKSQLKLIQNRKILNQYTTDYGTIELAAKLISLDTKHGIKMKYQLYDQDICLCNVYMILTYSILEN